MLPFALLATLLLSFQLLLPLKINKYYKLALILPIMVAAFKPEIIFFFGGDNYFAPDLPGWVILTAAWFYGIVFFSFFLLLIPAAATLAVRVYCFFRKTAYPEKLRKLTNAANAVLLIVAVLLCSFAMYNALRAPAVKEVELAFPDLPAAAENYRMTVLADLHIDNTSTPETLRALVKQANALQSNIIVILGDVVDGTVARQGETVKVLSELTAPDGVYGIMGNHEYFSGKGWAEFLSKCNIKMLLNGNVQVKEKFHLAGITDPAAKRLKGQAQMPDLDKALKGIGKGDFTVLLAHRPGHGGQAAAKGVQLQLSGHTHGGMIWGFDQLVGRFNENFISGAYKVKAMQLYVSNGSAIWKGFPYRLGHDSEITVIVFKKSLKQKG